MTTAGRSCGASSTRAPSGRVDADIDAEQAWTKTRGAGITVGVVDTGVDASHADLTGRVTTGYNAVNGGTDTTDAAGHGTHVAGIIGANADNGIGVAGVAPDATVLPIKVFSGANAYESDIADGFAYAGSHGIPVVNASLGGYGTSAVINGAMATYTNTLFVIAAGNNGTDNDVQPVTPCVSSLANVLCVGASTISDTKASFSNYGSSTVDLFAPGQAILSTYLTSTYQYLDGTSMASPYVAGAAALVAAQLGLRGSALAERIKATVDHPAARTASASPAGASTRPAPSALRPMHRPSRWSWPRRPAARARRHDVHPRGRPRRLPRLQRDDRRLRHERDGADDHRRRARAARTTSSSWPATPRGRTRPRRRSSAR